jgi:tetratricopeptide (TPR) repeat protein
MPVEMEENATNIVVTGTRRREDRAQDVPSAVTSVSAEELGSTDAAAADATPTPGANTGLRADAAIETAEWNPDRPWIAAFEAAGNGWAAEVDRQRVANGALPIFWFDLAEWQWRKGRAVEARRAAEAALDLPSRDNQTLSIVAARLQRYGDLDRALALLEQLADRENERPQPLRTMATLLMQRAEAHRVAGRTDAAKADLQRAISLLADAVLTVRREQPRGFVQTALMDANVAVARYRLLGGTDHALPQQLVALMDTDIRIVMEWNTPRTDLDLWVTQPNGEEVGYYHSLSATGGRLTADVTNGYGPEEFLLRQAAPGIYTIRANTFAADRSNPNGPSGLSVRIIRNFGRPNQTEEQMDVEMRTEDSGSRQLVGTITVAGPQARPRRR